MLKILSFAGVLVILMLFSGCATVRELPPEQRKGEPVTEEYKISRDLLVCFMNNDAKGFNKRLAPENRRNFDAEKFNTARNDMMKTLGTPVSFSYLTELEFVTFKLHVWKIKFRLVGKDREQKEKEYFSEALFRVISGRSDRNQVWVMGFNFL